MKVFAFALAPCVALLLASCDGNAQANNPPPPDQLSVGGTYATEVTLLSSTCSGITVETRPTVVTHTPGATAVTLTHASRPFPGSVANDGAFSTTPVTVSAGGTTSSITIIGTFTITAVEARVDVAVSAATPCTYAVRWAGPKDGAPNVIPGLSAAR